MWRTSFEESEPNPSAGINTVNADYASNKRVHFEDNDYEPPRGKYSRPSTIAEHEGGYFKRGGKADRSCSFSLKAGRPGCYSHNTNDCFHHPNNKLAEANRDRMAAFAVRVPKARLSSNDNRRAPSPGAPRPSTPVLDMNDPKVREFVDLQAMKKFEALGKSL